jgi:nucleoside-diphosphate-sugar epimerase
MRFLVTGAAGFVGSHLCERLLSDGHTVVGIDCFTAYYERSLKESNLSVSQQDERFELIEADLVAAGIESLLEGVDGVFHLAAQPGVRLSWDRFDLYLRHNVLATQRLLESVRHRPVPVVYASSSSIYGLVERLPIREEDRANPISPYGATKLAAEHIMSLYGREFGIPVVSLRYFTVYGPRQRPDMAFTRFLRAAIAGEPVEVLGDGEQSRDFTFVSDAVDATVRAIGATPGSRYNVGGGSRATINQVIEIIREVSGRPLAVKHGPRAAGDMAHTWANTDRARRELGWKPRTELGAGLAAQYQWASGTE